MRNLMRVLFFLMVVLQATADDKVSSTISNAMQQASSALNAPVFDIATCRTAANELSELLISLSGDPQLPAALWLCARCDNACGNVDRAGTNAYRIIKDYPTSDLSAKAYDLVWRLRTKNGQDCVAAAELAREYAEGLGSDPHAAHYWRECFDMHVRAEHWSDAIAVGLHCLKLSNPGTSDPALQLAVAQAAIHANEQATANDLLQQLTAHGGKTPQAVIAHRLLAASGDAQLHNQSAWTLYDKNSRRAEFVQPAVAQAAAHALWDLQEDAYRNYVNLVGTEDFSEGRCRSFLDKLESGYNDVLATDASLAGAALNKIGAAHELLAEALIRDSERTGEANAAHPSHERALPEFAQAVSAYARAFEQFKGRADRVQEASEAAKHAFDLTARQGDLVAAWGSELYRRAPQLQTGLDSRKMRVDYLIDRVAPVLSDAVEYYVHATDMAKYMPLTEAAASLCARLDQPLRAPSSDLTVLFTDYSHALQASAVEIGSMCSLSFDANAVTVQEVKIETQLDQMLAAARGVRQIMNTWNGELLKANLSTEAVTFWQEQNVQGLSETADALKILQDNLVPCLARYEKDSALPSQTFYRKLVKLQASAASEEYHALVTWHDYVSSANIHAPSNERLYARLAVVDPTHFGSTSPEGSATSRNP